MALRYDGRMRIRFYSANDDWSAQGAKITSPESLEAIRKALEEDGPIIVEHWFYRGASAPDRLFFDEFAAFMEYLNKQAAAGDAIHVWNFPAVCRDDNRLTGGKCPDDDGRVPNSGAY